MSVTHSSGVPAVSVPSGLGGLPQVGICLAPRPRLDGRPGLAAPHGAVTESRCLRRPVALRPVVTVKPAI
jgi:hypothetical protein